MVKGVPVEDEKQRIDKFFEDITIEKFEDMSINAGINPKNESQNESTNIESMTFKEYRKWCNDRMGDGCWGIIEAMTCIVIVENVNKLPFWKREKYWKVQYEHAVLEEFINPINKMISDLSQKISENNTDKK